MAKMHVFRWLNHRETVGASAVVSLWEKMCLKLYSRRFIICEIYDVKVTESHWNWRYSIRRLQYLCMHHLRDRIYTYSAQ